MENFQASGRWVHPFKQWHGLVYKPCAAKERRIGGPTLLQALLLVHEVQDVFNADQAGLFSLNCTATTASPQCEEPLATEQWDQREIRIIETPLHSDSRRIKLPQQNRKELSDHLWFRQQNAWPGVRHLPRACWPLPQLPHFLAANGNSFRCFCHVHRSNDTLGKTLWPLSHRCSVEGLHIVCLFLSSSKFLFSPPASI